MGRDIRKTPTKTKQNIGSSTPVENQSPFFQPSPTILTDQQRLNWLRLIRTPSIGPALFRRAINYFGSSQGAVDNIEELARFVGRKKPLRLASESETLCEMENITKFGAKLVAQGEQGYPPLINHIEFPPPLLTIKGNASLSQRRIISAVGSRNASALGMSYTQEICHQLAKASFGICSGLARGIDRAAHEAALPFGTIAVIAGGIDHIYPKEHEQLMHQVSHEGLLLTERPFGYIPKAKDFPRRNRLIAGCCEALIVFEAALRSGSLVSARLAVEQSRAVFAVPGHPKDPRAAGTNHLIKNGATPLDDIREIFEAMEQSTLYIQEAEGLDKLDSQNTESVPAHDEEHTNGTKGASIHKGQSSLVEKSKLDQLLDNLSHTPVSIDVLSRQSSLSSREIQAAILELDLSGKIILHGAGLISIK